MKLVLDRTGHWETDVPLGQVPERGLMLGVLHRAILDAVQDTGHIGNSARRWFVSDATHFLTFRYIVSLFEFNEREVRHIFYQVGITIEKGEGSESSPIGEASQEQREGWRARMGELPKGEWSDIGAEDSTVQRPYGRFGRGRSS